MHTVPYIGIQLAYVLIESHGIFMHSTRESLAPNLSLIYFHVIHCFSVGTTVVLFLFMGLPIAMIAMGKSPGIGKSAGPLKSRSCEINSRRLWIALKSDRCLRSNAAETPVKSQSNPLTVKTNLATSRLDEIWESELSFFCVCETHPRAVA